MDRHWLSEYTRGQAYELYCVPFSSCFHHKLYPVVVHICYLQFGICLLGVQTRRTVRRGQGRRRRRWDSGGLTGFM